LINKKGISPLIATVLLIGFTIVLAALVMRWGGTLFKTTTQTTGCESQGRLQCTSANMAFSIGTVTPSSGGQTLGFAANNEGTLNIKDLIVQREDTSGAKRAYTHAVPITVAEGTSVPVSAAFGSGTCVDLKTLYVTPVVTYTPSDGTSPCDITCTEQQVIVPETSMAICS